MEGGKGWSKVEHQMSSAELKKKKSMLNKGLGEEKGGIRHQISQKNTGTNNSSHLLLVNSVNSALRHLGPTSSLGAAHAVDCCNTCQ